MWSLDFRKNPNFSSVTFVPLKSAIPSLVIDATDWGQVKYRKEATGTRRIVGVNLGPFSSRKTGLRANERCPLKVSKQAQVK
jgi:hypothetical protein